MEFKFLFYLFLAIGWFIFSIIKRSQKISKPPVRKYSSPKEEKDLFKPVIKKSAEHKPVKHFSYDDEIVKEPEKESTIETIESSDEIFLKKVKPLEKNESISNSFSKHPPQKADRVSLQDQDNIVFTEEEKGIAADFKLKKAIVFSEILKRPQY